MTKTTAAPVDSAREFREYEMFFSTTDRRGVIRSGNDVFMRISGYAGPDLVGRPHNVIRHPDMPRAVFRLVWDYLKRGKAVAGYVKNLAADGRYYWVVAMITPLRDGYLSVRFKPTGKMQPVVESLYGAMRQIERDAVARGEMGNRGMDLATEKMLAALGEQGFADYDAFMATMLHAELKSRDATIARNGGQLLPAGVAGIANAGAQRLLNIYRRCGETYRQLNRLYAELDEYTRLHRELHDGFVSVAKLVQEFRLLALNATVKSAQLGTSGQCSGVIAARLGELSGQISLISGELDTRMQPMAVRLRSAVFNLAAARLQLEMIMLFAHELATVGPGQGVDGRDVDDLQTAFDGTIGPAVEELRAIETALLGFGRHSEDFRRLVIAMQVAQISGAVEASRLRDDGSLAQTFQDVRGQAEVFKTKLGHLVEVIAGFDRLTAAAPAIVRQITTAVEHTRRDVKEFLALLEPTDCRRGQPSQGASTSAQSRSLVTRENSQASAKENSTAPGHGELHEIAA